MMRIGAIDAFPENACSYYRSFGVLTKIKDLEIYPIEKLSWIKLFSIDVLYVARPDHTNYKVIIDAAKNLNIPVWIDWDDNPFNLPDFNPGKGHFAERNEVVKDCISAADVVSVSTEAIKTAFVEINDNIVVIENAHNDYNYPLEKRTNQRNMILWRGSSTHRGDLLSVSTQMFTVASNHDDWLWYFLGGDPWYITDYIKTAVLAQTLDILKYNEFLKKCGASILQAPLIDNGFNRSKSNISWIEGTYAGCAVIAPDMPEFNRPGVINYSSPEKYEYAIEKLMKSKEYRLKNYYESYDYIQDNLLLSQINKKREKIIWGLI